MAEREAPAPVRADTHRRMRVAADLVAGGLRPAANDCLGLRARAGALRDPAERAVAHAAAAAAHDELARIALLEDRAALVGGLQLDDAVGVEAAVAARLRPAQRDGGCAG